ncbi:MAG TPA: prepilin-type N-terminal cleavage/methylation domain-containing protein, partial [Polyangiaceae bacterium]|nr:prepilin-type N-terminal cleavage/methylation domain-containing protein [Polyangiaceae bacterium]
MKRRTRGYTAVELMMALGLFAVGVSGIIAMQKLTIVSNQHAKNLAIATHIAQAWMDQLAADSTLWTQVSGSLNSTQWVVNSGGSTDGVWQLPPWDANRAFGPGFDALGAPIQAAA